MEKNDCIKEKFSARLVGVFILVASCLLAFVGLLILPIVGLFFSLPLLILGLTFIIAPQSKACRLLLGRAGQS